MTLLPIQHIQKRILFIREHKVMLDSDLAELYGVSTKRLNEQVKRNRKRFPSDLVFQLTSTEKREVVAICDHLRHLKFSPVLPYVFTEHGALMVATVLKSERAHEMSLYVIRAFVRVRELLATHKDLARQLAKLEKKYDAHFKVVFDAIRRLMEPLPAPKLRRLPPIPKIQGFIAKAR
jgi:hypothetical protein